MKIDVLCVGKVKEKFMREAIDEYLKRLSRYAKVQVIEVPDEATPDGASPAEEKKVIETEGLRLLGKIEDSAYVIALAINGKQLSSEGLASKMSELAISGKSHIQFVIGGSLGLSDKVLSRADFKLSFSPMTFPHQLMRVILLEQVYRSFRINNHEPYHK